MGLLGAPFLLVGWSFVAGVYQSGNLRKEQQIIQQREIPQCVNLQTTNILAAVS